MNNPTILVIDDEASMRKLLQITLSAQSYRVIEAPTGKDGLIAAAMHPPDLVLLDLGLPDEDGQNLLLQLREWYSKPILVISARSTEAEIVKALDNGANDYLVKPFRSGELLARIRSALRAARSEEGAPIRSIGSLTLDFTARNVRKNGALLHLTATEYILREIWGPSFTGQSQYLRVYVGQLRRKIEDSPNQPVHIRTESGVGYRFTGVSL